ncbi:MAG: alanine--tRNA ligase-related protein, partial [Candidatus Taylorbacteria bacterium]
SLGDYFKKEAIAWSYEFLTSPEEGLGLNPSQLYVTVFEGDAHASRDDEAATIWRDIFTKNGIEVGGDTSKGEKGRIFYLPAKNNWWEAGDNGPCGPDSEMFYDFGNAFKGTLLKHTDFVTADDTRVVLEVWNDVFMQYEKKDGKIVGRLPAPSIDTGAGLERLTMTLQGVDNIYDTDLLKPVMDKIKSLSKNWDVVSARIVADHIKASAHLIADGVLPSNSDRGYVLRKLIRRAVRHADTLKCSEHGQLDVIAAVVIDMYKDIYPDVSTKSETILKEIVKEENKFRETLAHGLKEFSKLAHAHISGHDAFALFSSYGFPLELTLELAKEKNITVDVDGFNAEFKKHQDLSRSGAEQKFKGGLADANDPMVLRYHTATHLLHQALYDVLGPEVGQKGSNITAERLRFDFSWGAKMTDEQKKKVEDIINEKIIASLPMQQVVMPKSEAEKTGARHFFGEKYGDEISIYFVGTDLAHAYSKEFCGGPHVTNTSELAGPEGKWRFHIQKEEASSQGVRRIKAVLK